MEVEQQSIQALRQQIEIKKNEDIQKENNKKLYL